MVVGGFTRHACAVALGVATAFVVGCSATSRPLQLLGSADLQYPAEARAAGVEGVVRVRYDVTENGTVVNAKVEASEPVGVFDAAALAVVQSWRFRPAVEQGNFVAARDRVSEVRFQLGDTDRYVRPAAAPE